MKSRLLFLASAATMSDDGVYRYDLSRQLSMMGERTILFVGLNPSTADALKDDPTVRREIAFSRAWGFDWYLKGNLYAYRSTNPKVLLKISDPVGPANRDALERMVDRSELIVAAWGCNPLTPAAKFNAVWILNLEKTRCFGINQDGTPQHPLYLPKTSTLVRMDGRR